MKKILSIVGLVLSVVVGVSVAADAVRQGAGNQKLGFGTVISATANDSIAIGSSAAACSVTASQACQIGSGENTAAGTLQYRGNRLMDSNGGLAINAWAMMASSYAIYQDDWFEAGGYLAGNLAATTNCAKFSEVDGLGTWLVTVVDGGGDNAETISIMNDERNGILKLLPNNAANDGINCQMQGESFIIRSNNYVSGFSARFLISSTNVIGRFGLHMTGTTAAVGTPGTDYIGFYVTNSTLDTLKITFECAKNSASTSIVVAASVATTAFSECAFAVVSDVLIVKYNGAAIASLPLATTTTIPDDEVLSPVMAIKESTTGQGYVKMDLIGTVQTR